MRALRVVGLAVALSGCSSQETPTNPEVSGPAHLRVAGPASLLVNEAALFEVTARDALGRQVPMSRNLEWSTSDEAVADVSSAGVVRGRGRGTAVITVTSGALRAELTLVVTARVRILADFPDYPCVSCGTANRAHFGDESFGDESWNIALGDTLRFRASYVDVNGAPIGEQAPSTWTSSDADAVSISADGLVLGLLPAYARVVASSEDGADTVYVRTSDEQAGLPAKLRLAHAALGVDSVVFRFSGGAPVSLKYGESVDITIGSGIFYAATEGLPPGPPSDPDWRHITALVGAGDQLALYAATGALVSSWEKTPSVPQDSVRVRLVGGWTTAGVIFVFNADEPDGLLLACYFDPLNWTPYHAFAEGELDFRLQPKYGNVANSVHARVTPPLGQSTTYVIVQDSVGPPGLLAFADPPAP
jgi:hypothetical protein